MRKSIVVALVLLVVGGVGMGLFSKFQRRMVFPGPEGVTPSLLHRYAAEVGARELEIRTDDGESLYGWHRPALRGPGSRAVLYFHGNASSVLGQLDLQRRLNEEGWDFVEIHYRGYPGSTGVSSEAGVQRDAMATWRWVTVEAGVPAERVVIHGRSLGGGVAAWLGSEVKPGGVVLESTFTSVVDLAREQFGGLPLGPLLEHRFMTHELGDRVRAPVLVVHGSADSLIDVQHGKRLAEIFKAAYIEAPRVDHNEVLLEGTFADRYVAFLESVVPAEAR